MNQAPIFLGENLWETLQDEAKKAGRKDIMWRPSFEIRDSLYLSTT